MKIEKLTKKVKCDASGCDNIGVYQIVNKKLVYFGSMYFCESCLGELYELIGSVITPKSVTPIYKKKGVKDE